MAADAQSSTAPPPGSGTGGDAPEGGHGAGHGSTPAAWTTVIIVMVAFVVGSLGMMARAWWLFWVGVALIPAAVIVGKVLAAAGLGVAGGHGKGRDPRVPAPEERP